MKLPLDDLPDPLLENLWEPNLDAEPPLEETVNCCDPPSLKDVLNPVDPLRLEDTDFPESASPSEEVSDAPPSRTDCPLPDDSRVNTVLIPDDPPKSEEVIVRTPPLAEDSLAAEEDTSDPLLADSSLAVEETCADPPLSPAKPTLEEDAPESDEAAPKLSVLSDAEKPAVSPLIEEVESADSVLTVKEAPSKSLLTSDLLVAEESFDASSTNSFLELNADAPKPPVFEEAPTSALPEEASSTALLEEDCSAALLEKACSEVLLEEACSEALLEEACSAALLEEACSEALLEDDTSSATLEEATSAALLEDTSETVREEAASEALPEEAVREVESPSEALVKDEGPFSSIIKDDSLAPETEASFVAPLEDVSETVAEMVLSPEDPVEAEEEADSTSLPTDSFLELNDEAPNPPPLEDALSDAPAASTIAPDAAALE